MALIYPYGQWEGVTMRLTRDELSLLLSAHEAVRDTKQRWDKRCPGAYTPRFVFECLGALTHDFMRFWHICYFSQMSADQLLRQLIAGGRAE